VNQSLPDIIITPGDPAGIGPDLCLDLLNHSHKANLYLAIDPDIFQQRFAESILPIQLHSPTQALKEAPANKLNIIPFPLAERVTTGNANPANSQYILDTIRYATENCIAGKFNAMVTGPVNKAVINQAGIPFTGHTEYIEQICLTQCPETEQHAVMMLAADDLRVALLTTHVSLKKLIDLVTPDRLETVIKVVYQALQQKFGIEHPHLMICGLNPHAGEQGTLGTEEQTIIEPVIKQLQEQDYHLSGPMPADTIFIARQQQQGDAILAMYHDQGLPVLKTLGFGNAINITLGLPVIRTSVDHGTAYELAGTGNAMPGSLHAAIAHAIKMSDNALLNNTNEADCHA